MFCRNCGTQLPAGTTACPSCNTVLSAPASGPTPMPTSTPVPPRPIPANTPYTYPQPVPVTQPGQERKPKPSIDPRRTEQARILVIKGFASISAIVFGVLALTTLMRFIDTFESIITVFSTYEALATALGIVGYVVCGLLIAVFAALACVPLIHAVLDPAALNRQVIDRAILFGVMLTLISAVLWLCKLVFHEPSDNTVSGVLYQIFAVFGTKGSQCIVPAIIAVVILYVLRVKLLASAAMAD